jgi:hypothetical protein
MAALWSSSDQPSRNVLRRDGGDDDLWEVWGWYTHAMQRFTNGWRCTGMEIDVLHTRGNAEACTEMRSCAEDERAAVGRTDAVGSEA